MKIEAFLKKHVSGYLFGDLLAMSMLRGVGYPMVMATVAGIELLGGLLSVEPFEASSRAGAGYFETYWRTRLYPEPPERDLGKAIYKLARHALAHTYVTKPGIVVSKVGAGHLKRVGDDVRIDAITLAKDLKASYRKHVLPRLRNSKQRTAMQTRLDEMIKAYTDHASAIPPPPCTVHYFTGVSASSSSVPRSL